MEPLSLNIRRQVPDPSARFQSRVFVRTARTKVCLKKIRETRLSMKGRSNSRECVILLASHGCLVTLEECGPTSRRRSIPAERLKTLRSILNPKPAQNLRRFGFFPVCGALRTGGTCRTTARLTRWVLNIN